MGKRARIAVAGICVLAAALVISPRKPAVVRAQSSGCDATSFSGAYGYVLNGFVYDPQGNLYLIGGAGRLTSDGTGGITGADTISFDGSIAKRQYSGTYTMNGDCTGSLTFTTTTGQATHADFVAVNNAKEVNLVQTDSGWTITGVLKQQQRAQQQQTEQP